MRDGGGAGVKIGFIERGLLPGAPARWRDNIPLHAVDDASAGTVDDVSPGTVDDASLVAAADAAPRAVPACAHFWLFGFAVFR